MSHRSSSRDVGGVWIAGEGLSTPGKFGTARCSRTGSIYLDSVLGPCDAHKCTGGQVWRGVLRHSMVDIRLGMQRHAMPVPGTLPVSVASLPQRRDGEIPEYLLCMSRTELTAHNLDVTDATVWPQRQECHGVTKLKCRQPAIRHGEQVSEATILDSCTPTHPCNMHLIPQIRSITLTMPWRP
jgi:hypothetical protein